MTSPLPKPSFRNAQSFATPEVKINHVSSHKPSSSSQSHTSATALEKLNAYNPFSLAPLKSKADQLLTMGKHWIKKTESPSILSLAKYTGLVSSLTPSKEGLKPAASNLPNKWSKTYVASTVAIGTIAAIAGSYCIWQCWNSGLFDPMNGSLLNPNSSVPENLTPNVSTGTGLSHYIPPFTLNIPPFTLSNLLNNWTLPTTPSANTLNNSPFIPKPSISTGLSHYIPPFTPSNLLNNWTLPTTPSANTLNNFPFTPKPSISTGLSHYIPPFTLSNLLNNWASPIAQNSSSTPVAVPNVDCFNGYVSTATQCINITYTSLNLSNITSSFEPPQLQSSNFAQPELYSDYFSFSYDPITVATVAAVAVVGISLFATLRYRSNNSTTTNPTKTFQELDAAANQQLKQMGLRQTHREFSLNTDSQGSPSSQGGPFSVPTDGQPSTASNETDNQHPDSDETPIEPVIEPTELTELRERASVIPIPTGDPYMRPNPLSNHQVNTRDKVVTMKEITPRPLSVALSTNSLSERKKTLPNLSRINPLREFDADWMLKGLKYVREYVGMAQSFHGLPSSSSTSSNWGFTSLQLTRPNSNDNPSLLDSPDPSSHNSWSSDTNETEATELMKSKLLSLLSYFEIRNTLSNWEEFSRLEIPEDYSEWINWLSEISLHKNEILQFLQDFKTFISLVYNDTDNDALASCDINVKETLNTALDSYNDTLVKDVEKTLKIFEKINEKLESTIKSLKPMLSSVSAPLPPPPPNVLVQSSVPSAKNHSALLGEASQKKQLDVFAFEEKIKSKKTEQQPFNFLAEQFNKKFAGAKGEDSNNLDDWED